MTDTINGAALSEPLYGATLGQAVGRFFKKYATFSGRASRSEYWWIVLAGFIINIAFGIVVSIANRPQVTTLEATVEYSPFLIITIVIVGLFGLAVIVPSIAVTVRRLHDANFSGWFYLLTLVGLSIVVLILTLLDTKPEGARFDK